MGGTDTQGAGSMKLSNYIPCDQHQQEIKISAVLYIGRVGDTYFILPEMLFMCDILDIPMLLFVNRNL